MNYPSDHPRVLEYAYEAGLAYLEAGKPDRALPQFQFYVHNAGAETNQALECRNMIAQLLVAQGDPEAAIAELRILRDLLAAGNGRDEAVVGIDQQIARLSHS